MFGGTSVQSESPPVVAYAYALFGEVMGVYL
jgi:hypothetical protein